jgi:hypothetical protein
MVPTTEAAIAPLVASERARRAASAMSTDSNAPTAARVSTSVGDDPILDFR